MRAKILLTVLLAAIVSLFMLAPKAQASLEPVYTVGDMFAAVNAGDLNAASSFFAADAVANIKATEQSFESADEIRRFLENLHGDERAYEIVQLAMVDDTITLTLDIADHGHVWAQQKMTAEVRGGRIQSLEVTETRLTLWRISW